MKTTASITAQLFSRYPEDLEHLLSDCFLTLSGFLDHYNITLLENTHVRISDRSISPPFVKRCMIILDLIRALLFKKKNIEKVFMFVCNKRKFNETTDDTTEGRRYKKILPLIEELCFSKLDVIRHYALHISRVVASIDLTQMRFNYIIREMASSFLYTRQNETIEGYENVLKTYIIYHTDRLITDDGILSTIIDYIREESCIEYSKELTNELYNIFFALPRESCQLITSYLHVINNDDFFSFILIVGFAIDYSENCILIAIDELFNIVLNAIDTNKWNMISNSHEYEADEVSEYDEFNRPHAISSAAANLLRYTILRKGATSYIPLLTKRIVASFDTTMSMSPYKIYDDQRYCLRLIYVEYPEQVYPIVQPLIVKYLNGTTLTSQKIGMTVLGCICSPIYRDNKPQDVLQFIPLLFKIQNDQNAGLVCETLGRLSREIADEDKQASYLKSVVRCLTSNLLNNDGERVVRSLHALDCNILSSKSKITSVIGMLLPTLIDCFDFHYKKFEDTSMRGSGTTRELFMKLSKCFMSLTSYLTETESCHSIGIYCRFYKVLTTFKDFTCIERDSMFVVALYMKLYGKSALQTYRTELVTWFFTSNQFYNQNGIEHFDHQFFESYLFFLCELIDSCNQDCDRQVRCYSYRVCPIINLIVKSIEEKRYIFDATPWTVLGKFARQWPKLVTNDIFSSLLMESQDIFNDNDSDNFELYHSLDFMWRNIIESTRKEDTFDWGLFRPFVRDLVRLLQDDKRCCRPKSCIVSIIINFSRIDIDFVISQITPDIIKRFIAALSYCKFNDPRFDHTGIFNDKYPYESKSLLPFYNRGYEYIGSDHIIERLDSLFSHIAFNRKEIFKPFVTEWSRLFDAWESMLVLNNTPFDLYVIADWRLQYLQMNEL
jgi:hypothetical protein